MISYEKGVGKGVKIHFYPRIGLDLTLGIYRGFGREMVRFRLRFRYLWGGSDRGFFGIIFHA